MLVIGGAGLYFGYRAPQIVVVLVIVSVLVAGTWAFIAENSPRW